MRLSKIHTVVELRCIHMTLNMFSSCNSIWLEVPENTGKKDSFKTLCEKVIMYYLVRWWIVTANPNNLSSCFLKFLVRIPESTSLSEYNSNPLIPACITLRPSLIAIGWQICLCETIPIKVTTQKTLIIVCSNNNS